MADIEIKLIPREEFDRVWALDAEADAKRVVLADMCRANALAVVKRAGSGHLGSTLSSMDIVTRLYWQELNLDDEGLDSPDRDMYFSSKGHDVPALYSVLYAKGFLDERRFVNLRRIDGLEGHPDVSTPGVEANSGSLGMGISKGRGMAWAKKHCGKSGYVYVLTGDGEFQEGQNFESLQGAAHDRCDNLIVMIDHNKLQSDKFVDQIMSLGELESKLRAFGWHVQSCDGNDQQQVGEVIRIAKEAAGRPSIIIANTIKGKGVSFMEHTSCMKNNLYPWHAGAPDDANYVAAHHEVLDRVHAGVATLGSSTPVVLKSIAPPPPHSVEYSLQGEPVSLEMPLDLASKASSTFVAAAYGEALLEAVRRRDDIVVLDADLAADCRIRAIENAVPAQFIECGIAEQDMVSVAGGLARMGLLPVVNSFASFLASRANEQIYNNAGERTKIIYACHYAGLIPAGPGKSHQSLRDIGLLSSLPNMVIVQPGCQADARLLLDYALGDTPDNVAMRFAIGPSPREITPPSDYCFGEGKGYGLTAGSDAVLFAYGPVMLHEALLAADLLSSRSIKIRVVNMPWLNRFDQEWLQGELNGVSNVFVLDDHSETGGLGDLLLAHLVKTDLLGTRTYRKFGVDSYPAFGTPPEALAYHRLDGSGLANRILDVIG